MAGFIVLADGRAYAASNWGTDATLRAIARSVADEPLQAWLLSQQSTQVGMGMTSVDLREIAPQLRPVLAEAVRDAFGRVQAEGRFEELAAGDPSWPGWLQRFSDLVEMLGRSDAGEPPEEFNPHMRSVLPGTNGRAGPGWDVVGEG